MRIKFLIVVFFTISFLQTNYAQNYKFGKISKEELAEINSPLDSSANAVILYKKRKTHYDYNPSQGWILVTKIHQRIKLYNKDGFNWATKKISLYEGNNGRENISIKAYTYHLNGDKIEKIKLKNDGIFDEDFSENWRTKIFTMPSLKEGCIVEWEYSIKSPYYWNIDDVIFQYEIPVNKIETEISIPEYFRFKYFPTYYYPVRVDKTEKSRTLNFSYRTRDDSSGLGGSIKSTSRNASVNLKEFVYSSSEKNIPALREEPFVNNINNYRSKTSFELTAYVPKYDTHEYYNNTWEDVTKTIYKSSKFGGQLEKNAYFKNDISSTIDPAATTPEKIGKIFQFVKQKIKWNEKYGRYTKEGVKKAYNDGVGNAAEINLTLVAILRSVGLNSNPVLLSTRSNGVPLFPTTDGFNYVIAAVEIGESIVLLDATEKYSIPNVLPYRDLNWQGRLVRKDGTSIAVNLYPKIHSKDNTFLNVELDEEGYLKGVKRSSKTNLQALQYRKKNNALTKDQLIANLEKKYNLEINELEVTNKLSIGKPVIETIKFESDQGIDIVGNKLYLNPLLFLTESSNPFKLDERKYPVDFGSPWEDRCSISMTIPDGYTVESLPKKIAIGLPEKLGSFRYLISLEGNKIKVFSSIKFDSSIVAPQYYSALKDFYKKMIEKQAEKIVLIKS